LALTGLEALDALAGGLADDRVYLLHGPNGGGKTTLALQFLYNGLQKGEEAAIVTRRPARAIFDHGRAFGFDLEPFTKDGNFAIIEYLPKVVENSIRLRDEGRVFQELLAVLEESEPRRIVFDPLTPLLTTGSAAASLFRARTLIESLTTMGACTLLLLDTPEASEHVAQCKDFAHGILQFVPAEGGRCRINLDRFPGLKGRKPVIEFEVSPGHGLVSQLVSQVLPAAPGTATPARSCTVLVAEPDAVQREMIMGLLSKSCTVIEAEDGADVLAKVAVAPPSLAIIDADAPGFDGVTLCKRLRKNGLSMPVLLISNPIRRTRDRVAIMASGADDLLERPFDSRILTLKVQALLRRTMGGAVDLVADTAPVRDATVSTEDPAYFQQRIEAEALICRAHGLKAGVAVLRLTPGMASGIPGQALRDLALSLIREYDIVLLGRHHVSVLLAETDETGIRAFLRRFAEGWNRTPAPIVHFQTMDGQDAAKAAALEIVRGAAVEDTVV
jgi:DNA-binding response OmpR family regulator/KaiC/GvpD/RAD55 family RecA-like ATPase